MYCYAWRPQEKFLENPALVVQLMLEEFKFLLYLVEIGIAWKLLEDREIGRKE